MSTAVLKSADAPASPTLVPRNHVNLLRGVTWEQYLAYRDNPDNDGVRMYYADGELLQMTTGLLHERISHVMSLILVTWAHFSGSRIMGCGRWTLQQELKKKGLEADNCYYSRNLPHIQEKETVDLKVDPPPDLVIEVDITTHSQLKFNIYASLGIPEVWVWEGDRIAAHRLVGNKYELSSESVELPGFPLETAGQFVLEHIRDDDVAVMDAFREHLQS
jgi:Uma2 family endonuclease